MAESHIWELLLWATVAAAGFLVVDKVFNVWTSAPPAWLLAIAAGLFALIDWTESTQSFKIALRANHRHGAPSSTRSALRALGVVLFIFGAAASWCIWQPSVRARLARGRFARFDQPVRYWVVISFGAGLGVGLGRAQSLVRARPRHRRAS